LLFLGGLNSLGGIPNLPWQGYARWERENPRRKRLGPWEKTGKESLSTRLGRKRKAEQVRAALKAWDKNTGISQADIDATVLRFNKLVRAIKLK
jgi:hypothetical protein